MEEKNKSITEKEKMEKLIEKHKEKMRKIIDDFDKKLREMLL